MVPNWKTTGIWFRRLTALTIFAEGTAKTGAELPTITPEETIALNKARARIIEAPFILKIIIELKRFVDLSKRIKKERQSKNRFKWVEFQKFSPRLSFLTKKIFFPGSNLFLSASLNKAILLISYINAC